VFLFCLKFQVKDIGGSENDIFYSTPSQCRKNYKHKNRMKMNEIYKTSDFALVSTLYALNYKFEHKERDAKGRVVFFFDRDAHLDVVVEKYENGDLCVEPQKFFQAQKFLKTIIHSKSD